MAVDLIGGSASSGLQSLNLQTQTLSQQDFLKIMLTQLQFQDPLKPMDNEQFLAQMAQFSSLAQTAQMNDRIDTLLTVQAATQSIGLIGKTVQVDTASTSTVGTVSSLSFSSGTPSLTVTASDGSIMTGVSVSQISVIR
jgi:flagellar basal-body rod modification protein FlgD